MANNILRKQYKWIRCTIVCITVVCLFVTSSIGSAGSENFMTQRRKNAQAFMRENGLVRGNNSKGNEQRGAIARSDISREVANLLTAPSVFDIPEAFGTVKETYFSGDNHNYKLRGGEDAEDVSARGGKKLVIHIQDIHNSVEAQRNVAKIIDKLNKDTGVSLICTEGSSGKVNTGLLASFPHEEVRREVGDYP